MWIFKILISSAALSVSLLIPVFPIIRGADIVARTIVEITPHQPMDFHWEGHGFKVHIPVGAIRRERGRVTLCIQASLSGDYQLPDDGVLVSGVYWLSLYPHVGRFDKKVTISLQHCASDDDSSISFVTAKCTQETLPYTFKPLPGGSFDVSKEGTILVDHFSAVATAAHHNSISDYAVCSYYIPKHINVTDIHITVTPDHDLQLQVCIITKYGSTLYIGMDEAFQNHVHTFEKSDLDFVNSVLLPQNGSYGQHTRVPKNCITNNGVITKSSISSCSSLYLKNRK